MWRQAIKVYADRQYFTITSITWPGSSLQLVKQDFHPLHWGFAQGRLFNFSAALP
jgi:hypothetical protein